MKISHALIACLEVAFLAAKHETNPSPYRIAQSIHDVQKIGEQLHRRYEAQCSYPWANTERYQKRTEALEAKADTAAAFGGLTVEFQRDPRGWPIIVKFPNTECRLGGAA